METEKVREKGWSRKPRGCVWDCPGVGVGIFEITQRSAPGLRSPTDRSGTSSPSYEGQKRDDSVNKM